MKKKVFVVDPLAEKGLQGLEALGVEVCYCPDLPAAEVKSVLGEAFGLILRSKVAVDESLLAAAPALRFVARAGAGLECIDLKATAARNIRVLHAAEGNACALAEHALGMLLALLNHIPSADRTVKEAKWLREAHRGQELKGKCVGLLGFGHMGRAFAQRLQGFGCEICAHDTHSFKTSEGQVQALSLAALQARVDILSLHMPIHPENKHFVDKSFFAALQKPIILLNTARGGILDHEALCEGLGSGRIRGAALDVLENEDLKNLSQAEQQRFDFLRKQENVLFSPHVAGWTRESFVKIAEVLLEKIRIFIQETQH